MRLVWLTCGLVSVGIGILGIFLPLLPTVPLMILAAFCFGKSSHRLEAWLLDHPTYGPHIRNWRDYGAISRKAKRLSTVALVVTLAISLIVGLPAWVLTVQAITLAAVAAFIWSRPSR